jgi:hypothetical protein
MSEVYIVFFILQTTRSRWEVAGLITRCEACQKLDPTTPRVHVKDTISLLPFCHVAMQHLFKNFIYPPGGMRYKKVRGVFPRTDFTLSRNAEDWEILVYIIM